MCYHTNPYREFCSNFHLPNNHYHLNNLSFSCPSTRQEPAIGWKIKKEGIFLFTQMGKFDMHNCRLYPVQKANFPLFATAMLIHDVVVANIYT